MLKFQAVSEKLAKTLEELILDSPCISLAMFWYVLINSLIFYYLERLSKT